MKIETVLRLAAAAVMGLFVASCQDEMASTLGGPGKATRPLNAKIVAQMDEKGMRKEDPILVRAFKQEATLEIWKRDRTGRFALLKSYPMCAWGGTLGPKIKEGDKQSPEGFYTVTPGRMNPNSQFYLAYDVGYPNAFDRAFGRTGAAVMVHGGCTGSAGCFVMTDEQVEEIYGLAREAFNGGQKSFQVQAFPFRMTAENLAKNRKNPNMAFWKNIKQGYDHFEVTKLEPKVEVCDKRYVFDAHTTDPNSTMFNPTGACPAYEVPSELKTAVAAKEAEDDKAFKVAVAEIEDQARQAEDRARKMEERAIADAREKAKPQPGVKFASWLGAKPDASDEAVGDFSAAGMPVAVPLPKASPRSFGPTRVAAVQAGGVEVAPAAPAAASEGMADRLFGFVAPQKPADPAAQAVHGGDDKPLWKKINPFGG
ncbi:MAG: murein L,D-transpeptidase [Hyphomicrobiales bacterium]|nr:murein L,D-transpeptidase [Hyphomicrobiales bacterium]